MVRTHEKPPAGSALLVVIVWIAPRGVGAPRRRQWKEVDEAVAKGLPNRPLKSWARIIQGALKDKAWGEATKGHRAEDCSRRKHPGNKPEERSRGWEAEIAKAPKEIVRCRYDPGQLVLALLPAESLAIHAAQRNRPSRRARIFTTWTCSAFHRNRPAFQKRWPTPAR